MQLFVVVYIQERCAPLVGHLFKQYLSAVSDGVLVETDPVEKAELPDEDPGSEGWPVQSNSGGQDGVKSGQVKDPLANFALKIEASRRWSNTSFKNLFSQPYCMIGTIQVSKMVMLERGLTFP